MSGWKQHLVVVGTAEDDARVSVEHTDVVTAIVRAELALRELRGEWAAEVVVKVGA